MIKIVYWLVIMVKDNDGEVFDMEVILGYILFLVIFYNFLKGIYDVIFRVRDWSGNLELCYFRVEVKGSRCWLFIYVVKLLKLERVILIFILK